MNGEWDFPLQTEIQKIPDPDQDQKGVRTLLDVNIGVSSSHRNMCFAETKRFWKTKWTNFVKNGC